MTDAERKIIEALGDIWNQYAALPVQHPMDHQEFCTGVHRLQEKVAARPALRTIRKEQSRV